MRNLIFSIYLVGLAVVSRALYADDAPPFAVHDGDRIAFYGDSITQDGGYGRIVQNYVRTRFPLWDVRFYNAGVGGDTVKGGGAGDITTRLTRDLIPLNPTVVTIMLGMNDGHYRPLDALTATDFESGYRAIVKRLRTELPKARIYLIRTSPFDDVARTANFVPGYDVVLSELGASVSTIGREYSLPVVDFASPLNAGIARVMASNPDLARMLLPDRVHPSKAGHLVLGAALLRAWNAPVDVTRVEIDARLPVVQALKNTTVVGLGADGHGLQWQQLDLALPLPLNFDDADTDLAQRAQADLDGLDREVLVVTGLDAARYLLNIDGKPIGSFTKTELSNGINLARYETPMRRQASRVLWAVESGDNIQKLRRELLAHPGEKNMGSAAAEVLAERDERDQKIRSNPAKPELHLFTLDPVP